MFMVLTIFATLVITAALFAVGLVVVGRDVKTAADSRSPAAQKALEQIQNLAGRVSTNGEKLAQEVEQITNVLKTIPADDQAALAAVTRLVQINQQIQQQLVSAEERLNTQSRQMEAHAFEARTDALTQVANRRSFDDALARRIEAQQRRGVATTIMLLDLDHFKKFNDSHGHQA